MSKREILSLIKYLFCMFFMLIAYRRMRSETYLIIEFFELLTIFFITNSLFKLSKILAWLVNSFLVLFFNAQLILLYFAGTHLNMIMLSNLNFISDLKGKAAIYISSAIAVIITSILPVSEIRAFRDGSKKALILALCGEILIFNSNASLLSPYANYINLGIQKINLKDSYENIANNESVDPLYFYKEGITKGYSDYTDENNKPNIILLFAEGLSHSITEDSRNITPNISFYEKNSISFKNYYDHTAATLRAISGQLYSGYQLENNDENTLISLQEILRNNGYYSMFINTEPYITDFLEFLKMLNFNEVVNEPTAPESERFYLTDRESFLLLEEKIKDLNKKENPFFVSMYLFGTHVSLDSPDEKFGDEKSPILNKFYNLDYQFGEFMEWFNESGDIPDNTILVFTSDHGTFVDSDWSSAFLDTPRAHGWVDTIPFFLYKKGIEPKVIDAQGRNSLDMAPTVLDFINIGEDQENYFLGDSLFTDSTDNDFNTIFFYGDFVDILSTKDGIVYRLPEGELDIAVNNINKYLSVKTKDRPKVN